MNNTNNLDNLRHSAAHLLAKAVLELWPGSHNAIGPAIENGFYQDFDMGQVKLSEADLPKIEAKMRELLPSWQKFSFKEVTLKEAEQLFKHNPYKVELAQEFAKEGQKLQTNDPGNFLDLCKMGHVENPAKELVHFKLLSVAGAYWRGDEKNKMLTRVYGTVFPTKGELEEYLQQAEEAEKRDNRKLGKDLELYTISPHVGPGLILWLPKGTILREELEKLGKEVETKYGFQRVTTPHIGKEELYVTSGHLPYYAQDMWPPMEYEGEKYYVKPMNCPHMHMIYKFRTRSYKELPIRYAEFGTVYRHEDSGTLTGLLRVRGHTTNDAHIYCAEEHVIDETIKVMEMHAYYYQLFNIKNYYVELALPDFKKKADKYFNDIPAWEKAIDLLRQAAKQINVEVVEKEGGAAFYGPKFDFNIKSVIGREFGASTNQLDFGSGKRFGLTYVDRDGSEKTIPYILHRAPLGSEERFLGFLIEHYAGAFPTWLSPVQVVIMPISDKHLDYAKKVEAELKESLVRVELNDKREPLNARVRDAEMQKTPYIIVVGDKEADSESVAVRRRGNKETQTVKLPEFVAQINREIATRANS